MVNVFGVGIKKTKVRSERMKKLAWYGICCLITSMIIQGINLYYMKLNNIIYIHALVLFLIGAFLIFIYACSMLWLLIIKNIDVIDKVEDSTTID